MPQIIQITSEAIQAQIRRLLPSQQGFGIDMEASSVITPIIDITPAAEGSQLPDYLQTALDFGSTFWSAEGGTTNITTTPGFYRTNYTATIKASNTVARLLTLAINDGASDNTIWSMSTPTGALQDEIITVTSNIVCFLRAGDTLKATASTNCNLRGTIRQVADVYGNLVVPNGFTFE